MVKNKLLTLILMGISLNSFNEASGISEINARVAFNTSHNENCIMNMMRKNFIRNTTVTIFSSDNVEYSQMERNLIENIFTSINCSVILCKQMTQSRVYLPWICNNLLEFIYFFCIFFRCLPWVSDVIFFLCWVTKA